MLEVVPHMCSKGRDRGSGTGRGDTWGASRRNSWMWKRDNASAVLLWMPGMCWAAMVKLCLAANRKMLRRRCIMCGQWEVPELTQWTIAKLSHRKRRRRVDHRSPKI